MNEDDVLRTGGLNIVNHLILHGQGEGLGFHHAVGVDVAGGGAAVGIEIDLGFGAEDSDAGVWCGVGAEIVADLDAFGKRGIAVHPMAGLEGAHAEKEFALPGDGDCQDGTEQEPGQFPRGTDGRPGQERDGR